MVREKGSALLMLLVVGVVLSVVMLMVGNLLSQKVFLMHREKIVYDAELVGQKNFDRDVDRYMSSFNPLLKVGVETEEAFNTNSSCSLQTKWLGESDPIRVDWFPPGCFGESYQYSIRLKQEIQVGVGRVRFSRASVLDWTGDEYDDWVWSRDKKFSLHQEDGLWVVIHDKGARFVYQMDSSQLTFGMDNPYLAASEIHHSFFMILGGSLWRLSKDGTILRMVDISGETSVEVISDYIVDDNLLLLMRYRAAGNQYYFEILKVSLKDSSFPPDRFGVSGLVVRDDYNVVRTDRDGVLLENKSGGRVLLAIAWSGRPRWGTQYLWMYGNNIQCGLGLELFEPKAGYVIGCQRKRE